MIHLLENLLGFLRSWMTLDGSKCAVKGVGTDLPMTGGGALSKLFQVPGASLSFFSFVSCEEKYDHLARVRANEGRLIYRKC